MDYKQKYLKYKQKYIDLKNKIELGGGNEDECKETSKKCIIIKRKEFDIDKIINDYKNSKKFNKNVIKEEKFNIYNDFSGKRFKGNFKILHLEYFVEYKVRERGDIRTYIDPFTIIEIHGYNSGNIKNYNYSTIYIVLNANFDYYHDDIIDLINNETRGYEEDGIRNQFFTDVIARKILEKIQNPYK